MTTSGSEAIIVKIFKAFAVALAVLTEMKQQQPICRHPLVPHTFNEVTFELKLPNFREVHASSPIDLLDGNHFSLT